MGRLADTLERSIERLRSEVGDPFAQIGVLVSSPATIALAQRTLGRYVRVRFLAPGAVVEELGAPPLIRRGLRPEPVGWLEATTLVEARNLADRYPDAAEVLQRGAWAPALAAALGRLERAGVAPDQLRALDTDDAERAHLLGDLMAAVHRARSAAGLFGPADLARQARASVVDREVPRSLLRDRAYVVVGERALAPLLRDALAAWLAERPGLRIAREPEGPDAPDGLRSAASGYPRVDVPPAEPSALAALQAGRTAPKGDRSVRFVRALDERREAREVARAVVEAIRAGAALGDVAVVLPRIEQADLLWSELSRAGVGYVSLVGPPLSSTPEVGLLFELSAVAEAPDAADLSQLHTVLTHPVLSTTACPAGVRRARPRFRRLLSRLGPLRGLDAVRTAARSLAVAERDRSARDRLVEGLDRLADLKGELPSLAVWSDHLLAWRSLAAAWLRPSQDRERILAALEVRGGGGPRLTIGEARKLMRHLLDGRSRLVGGLNDPAVRILPPLELQAVDAPRVIVCGLADGGFPGRPVEDPVLSDRLIEQLRADGARLEGSAARATIERRRFAAAVGAAEAQLVLSVPRSELMSGRPVGPGALLLDAARTLGWAQTYRELDRLLEPADTDAAGVIRKPERALDATEHRLASVAGGGTDAVRTVAAHPFGRRLLAQQRSLDRARATLGAARPDLDAHTGRVRTRVGFERYLRGHALSEGALALLLSNPGEFFLRVVLEAYRPRALPVAGDAFDGTAVLTRMARSLPGEAPVGASPLEALRVRLIHEPESEVEMVKLQALQRLEKTLPSVTVQASTVGVVGGGGLAVEVAAHLASDEGVVQAVSAKQLPSPASVWKNEVRAALRVLATGQSGLHLVAPRSDERRTFGRAEVVRALGPRIALARALLEAGWFPFSGDAKRAKGGLSLGRDAVWSVVEEPERLTMLARSLAEEDPR